MVCVCVLSGGVDQEEDEDEESSCCEEEEETVVDEETLLMISLGLPVSFSSSSLQSRAVRLQPCIPFKVELRG